MFDLKSYYFFYRAKLVAILGTKFKVAATLHIEFNDNEFPAFWEINEICVVNKNYLKTAFVITAIETVEFNEHYQSYEVVAPLRKNIKFFYFKDFTCHVPLNQVKPYGLLRKIQIC